MLHVVDSILCAGQRSVNEGGKRGTFGAGTGVHVHLCSLSLGFSVSAEGLHLMRAADHTPVREGETAPGSETHKEAKDKVRGKGA